jgi:hypothetical protein
MSGRMPNDRLFLSCDKYEHHIDHAHTNAMTNLGDTCRALGQNVTCIKRVHLTK